MTQSVLYMKIKMIFRLFLRVYIETMENTQKQVRVDGEKKTHIYRPRSHSVWESKKTKQTDEDGWTTIQRIPVLVSQQHMMPCPIEEMNGNCELRCIEQHRLNNYHFTKERGGLPLHDEDGKPICRYHLGDCWESRNGAHRRMFVHK